jgi:hypothetical protein
LPFDFQTANIFPGAGELACGIVPSGEVIDELMA